MTSASSPANRAPLILAVVVLLGLGHRVLTDRADAGVLDSPAAAALDSQLARTSRAASGTTRRPSKRAPRSATDPAKKRGGTTEGWGTSSHSVGTIRQEHTPVGALPPELLPSPIPQGGKARSKAVVKQPSARRLRREPDPPPGPIDVETASAAELERLPRVGPTLAARIVADREANGPFGSLKGLQRVRGIGPVMTRQLQSRVTFGQAGRP